MDSTTAEQGGSTPPPLTSLLFIFMLVHLVCVLRLVDQLWPVSAAAGGVDQLWQVLAAAGGG